MARHVRFRRVVRLSTRARSVTLSALAAVHWAWSGLVYHALFFISIPPPRCLPACFCWRPSHSYGSEWFAAHWCSSGATRCDTRWRALYSRIHSRIHFWSWLRATTFHAPLFAVPCPTPSRRGAAHCPSSGSVARLRHSCDVGHTRRDRCDHARGHAGSDVGLAAVCLVVYVVRPFIVRVRTPPRS